MIRGLLCFGCVLAALTCRNFGEPATTLAVSPPALAFTAPLGGLGPPRQPLTMDRRGTGRLVWRASADVPWLRIAPAQDTAPAVAWVTAALQGLPVGSHRGRLVVAAADDSAVVTVTFVVTATPTLTGRWAFAGDTLNVGLLLTDADGVVTGSGSFNSPGTARRFFTVQGTAQPPAVTLTLRQTNATTVAFTGSLRTNNVLDAVLDGGGFNGARVSLFRQ